MLDIRPTCEHCNKALAFDSKEAMICTFECSYCVETLLEHVCPNCGGGFEKRPIRPEAVLKKYPVSTIVVHKPVDIEKHQKRIKKP